MTLKLIDVGFRPDSWRLYDAFWMGSWRFLKILGGGGDSRRFYEDAWGFWMDPSGSFWWILWRLSKITWRFLKFLGGFLNFLADSWRFWRFYEDFWYFLKILDGLSMDSWRLSKITWRFFKFLGGFLKIIEDSMKILEDYLKIFKVSWWILELSWRFSKILEDSRRFSKIVCRFLANSSDILARIFDQKWHEQNNLAASLNYRCEFRRNQVISASTLKWIELWTVNEFLTFLFSNDNWTLNSRMRVECSALPELTRRMGQSILLC